MNEQQIDWQEPSQTWSKLSRKERRRLIKEQKKQMQETQQRQGDIRKWVFFGVIIVLVVVGGFWFFKESSKPLPGELIADQGREHVPSSEWEKFKYNSNPPTSGPHDAVWTKAGVYTKPQGDGHLVHSLEHGYVAISYNCSGENPKSEIRPSTHAQDALSLSNGRNPKLGTESGETDKDCLKFVDKLKERVKKDEWKLILVPRPNLDTNFAMTAWRRIDKFNIDEANIDRVNDFIKALRNAGPEQTME